MRRLSLSVLPVLSVLSGVLLSVLLPVPSATAAVDPGTGQQYETAPVTVPMVFPVVGGVRWSDTFLSCRSGCARLHMGQDLMAPKMTPLVAPFDGVVTSLVRDASWGNALTVTADRGRAAGWSVSYLHVNNDTPGTDDGRGSAAHAFPAGLGVGSRVLGGQLVGWVGDSGNAETTGPHLHVELRRTGPGRVVHDLAPSLRAARVVRAPLASGPHPTGTLLRHPKGSLWLLSGANDAPSKHHVSPAVLAANGLSAAAALPMTAAESMGYPTGSAVVPRDGSVVRDPSGATWLVTAGTRAPAPLPALAALGLTAPRVHPVRDADLAGLPVGALPASPVYPGALLRRAGRLQAVGADGRLHAVSSVVAGSHGWQTRDVVEVPADGGPADPAVLLEPGDPLPLRDGTLVTAPGPRVGVVSAGAFRRLHDARQVASYGYTGRPRRVVPTGALAGLREGLLTGP